MLLRVICVVLSFLFLVMFLGSDVSAQTEIIMDNGDTGYSDVMVDTGWTTGTFSGDKYGPDYRYNSTGAGNDKATWETTISAAGDYEVYVWYPQGSNRPIDVPYTVFYEGGSQTIDINQTTNGGQWNLLGTFSFSTGTYSVEVSDDAEASKVIMADAVRWYLPSSNTPTDTPTPTNTPVTTPEGRVAWIDVWGCNSESKIVTACQKAVANNMNGVAIEVRYRGDALYVPNRTNSTYPNPEPRSEQLNGQPQDFDPLQTCIDEAHSRGLEVHAWVVTNCIWSSSTAPTDPDHIYNAHPEWITENNNGVTMTVNDAEGAYNDPGIIAVRDYTLNVFKDICVNYDIDGFHLDYIRYPGTNYDRTLDWGHDPVALNRYTNETGETADPQDATWQQWKRDQITAIVSGMWDFITTNEPDLAFSASILGNRNDAHGWKFQDAKTWAEEPIIDVIYPMCYSTNTSTVLSQANDWFQNSGTRNVFVGLRAYGVSEYPTSQLVEKVNQIRASSYFEDGNDGFGFFDSMGLQESNDAFYNALSSGPLSSWEQMPPIPARPNPTDTPTDTPTLLPTDIPTDIPTDQPTSTPTDTPTDTPTSVSTPTDVIVDNDTTGFNIVSGTWTSYNGGAQQYGSNIRYNASGSGNDKAKWEATLNQTGNYSVYVWYPSSGLVSQDSPFTVFYTGGSQTFDINQQANGGQWNLLGTFYFDSGTHKVELTDDAASGYLVADAIRWAWDSPAGPTDTPTDTPTNTPTDTASNTPTNSPTNTPTDTPTDFPTDTPTDPPTATPTDTQTDGPTDTPTDTPAETPTDSPTSTPTNTPTDGPTDTPTDNPTDTPTDTPTATPSDTPTNTPTLASTPTDIIVDEADSDFSILSGTWPNYSAGYNGNVKYNASGNGSDVCQFQTDIPQAGNYDVYVRYPASGSLCANDSPFIINYEGGSDTIDVNQQTDGNHWNLLGTYYFNADTYTITLSDDAQANKKVVADAVMWSWH